MSWLTDLFNQKVREKTTGTGQYFYPLNSASSILWGKSEYLTNYLEIPEVAAVINMKARAFSNMKIEIVSKLTGEEVKNNDPLVRALRYPNYFQSQKEFLMQTKIFQEIYGNEFIYFLQPAGFSNNIKGIFTISPEHVLVDTSAQSTAYFLYDQMLDKVRYRVSWGGEEILSISNDDLIHINSSNVRNTENNWLNGESPMVSLAMPIQNIRASYEARNVLIENRGALGILSNGANDVTGGAVPMDPKEKGILHEDLKKYGMSKSQRQFILTNLNLKWQQMTIDADKLQLHEENRESLTRICDVYGVPFELMGNQKGVTFDNKKAAEKQMYQNTIIPEALEWIDGLNRRFETKDKSWDMKVSFDHLPIFEEDSAQIKTKDDMWAGRYKNNLITLNQYNNAVGLPITEDGDKYAKDDKSMPLVTSIGVGGVQAIQSLLADQIMTPDQKINTLLVVFGIPVEQGRLMVGS